MVVDDLQMAEPEQGHNLQDQFVDLDHDDQWAVLGVLVEYLLDHRQVVVVVVVLDLDLGRQQLMEMDLALQVVYEVLMRVEQSLEPDLPKYI